MRVCARLHACINTHPRMVCVCVYDRILARIRLCARVGSCSNPYEKARHRPAGLRVRGLIRHGSLVVVIRLLDLAERLVCLGSAQSRLDVPVIPFSVLGFWTQKDCHELALSCREMRGRERKERGKREERERNSHLIYIRSKDSGRKTSCTYNPVSRPPCSPR